MQKKCLYRGQTKKERILERIREKFFQQCVRKIKENNDLNSSEVDVVTNFIKNEVESFPDDDNASKEDRVIGFIAMRVTNSRILLVQNGVLWDTKNPIKRILFFLLGI